MSFTKESFRDDVPAAISSPSKLFRGDLFKDWDVIEAVDAVDTRRGDSSIWRKYKVNQLFKMIPNYFIMRHLLHIPGQVNYL